MDRGKEMIFVSNIGYIGIYCFLRFLFGYYEEECVVGEKIYKCV